MAVMVAAPSCENLVAKGQTHDPRDTGEGTLSTESARILRSTAPAVRRFTATRYSEDWPSRRGIVISEFSTRADASRGVATGVGGPIGPVSRVLPTVVLDLAV